MVDTNVLSERVQPVPSPKVMGWLVEQDDLVVSAISVGEIRRGALALPTGRRRENLLAQIDSLFAEHVSRILAYNGPCARLYAHLHARRRSLGRPLAVEDGMIAATAIIHSAAIATRNVADFEDLGLEIIDPWNL